MPLRVALSTYRASYEIRNRLQLHVSFIVATLVAMKDVAEVESARATAASPNRKAPIPKQIRYIIGNEGCEPRIRPRRPHLSIARSLPAARRKAEVGRALRARRVARSACKGLHFTLCPVISPRLAGR